MTFGIEGANPSGSAIFLTFGLCYTTPMSDPLSPTLISLVDELDVTIPHTEDILTSTNPPLEEVRKKDMLMLNFNLAMLYALWDKIETIPGAFAMFKEQRELIKDRRAILGLAYGSPQNTASKVVTWEPLP